MRVLFYDDPLSELTSLKPSVFLAGPTSRDVSRTAWRTTALELFENAGFTGTLLIPEPRAPLERGVRDIFGAGRSEVPGMSVTSFNILAWETAGIEGSSLVLFWMPFVVKHADDPESLPGFTTRAEVGRELVRTPRRVVLGMPKDAVSGGHLRFHAARAGVRV